MVSYLIEGSEPAHVAGHAEIRARAGLAQNGLVRVVGGALGGADVDRRPHPDFEVGNAARRQLEHPLRLGLKLFDFLRAAGILQVVQRAPIGDGRKQRR